MPRRITSIDIMMNGYRVMFSARYLAILDRKLFLQPDWVVENERRHYRMYKVTWRNIFTKEFPWE